MSTREANEIVSALVAEATRIGPQDPLTIFAYGLNTVCRLLLLPTLLLIPLVTAVLGLLVAITFGLLLLPLSLLWMPIFGFLIGSSWLWIRAWYVRPLILILGVVIAILGNLYTSFVLDMGEKYQKVLKIGLCDSWPHSYNVFRLARYAPQEDSEL